MPDARILDELAAVIRRRFEEEPEGSYVASLKRAGLDRMLQKVGEEAVETVLAGKNADDARFVAEAADLVFHLLVALEGRGVALSALYEELARRRR